MERYNYISTVGMNSLALEFFKYRLSVLQDVFLDNMRAKTGHRNEWGQVYGSVVPVILRSSEWFKLFLITYASSGRNPQLLAPLCSIFSVPVLL